MVIDILIKSQEEILRNRRKTGIFWNDPYMKKFCGKLLKNVEIVRNWSYMDKLVYRYCESENRSWMFAESWVEEVIHPQLLEDDLFIL